MTMTWVRSRSFRFAVLLALFSLGSHVGFASASSAAPGALFSQDSVVVYVARRGWHIDIGFEAADLKPPLDSLMAELPRGNSLFFGFGDRRYLDSENRHAPVLVAALWPGRGLILVTALAPPASDAFGASQVIALKVSANAARDLQAFIWHSVEDYRPYRRGPYEGSVYFTARPKYSALYTCNTWAAQALVAAGLPIRASGTLLAAQLWGQVRRVAKSQSTATPATVEGPLSREARRHPDRRPSPMPAER